MDALDWHALEEDVKRAEGYREKAYKDSVGVWTIGYGTNLQELKIDKDLAAAWLEKKLREAKFECEATWPWFLKLSPVRQRALIELVYNMGMPRVLKFTNTLKAFAAGNYAEAANGLANSLWAIQVGPTRSRRIIRMVEDDTATS